MGKPNLPESDFSGPSKHRPAGQPVHTTYDAYGEVLAYYTFYPNPRILYVDWQGHFTSHDFVQAATRYRPL